MTYQIAAIWFIAVWIFSFALMRRKKRHNYWDYVDNAVASLLISVG